jgi:hypothetical protein
MGIAAGIGICGVGGVAGGGGAGVLPFGVILGIVGVLG